MASSRAIAVLAPVLVCILGAADRGMAAHLKVLYRFQGGNDGTAPSTLAEIGGTLYGTTTYGGDSGCMSGCGTIFSIDPKTHAETVLYRFRGDADGASPGPLLAKGGVLYGTTSEGGASGGSGQGNGTVFSFRPATGEKTTIYSLPADGEQGVGPEGSLVEVNGTLFGVAVSGGNEDPNCQYGCGTVFSVDLTRRTGKLVHAFRYETGFYPRGGIAKVGARLYGTLNQGGANHHGALFSLDPQNGRARIEYSFGGIPDGLGPAGDLLVDQKTIYGTTFGGGLVCQGLQGCGTIFAFDTETGIEQVVYRFQGGEDGDVPASGVTAVGGLLYGTTAGGGGNGCRNWGCGTIFSVDPSTGSETMLVRLGGRAGKSPEQNNLLRMGTVLYGTTPFGGSQKKGSCYGNSCGVVFRLNP